MILTYGFTLLATLAVELAIAFCLTLKSRPKYLLLIVLCANLVTHPLTIIQIFRPGLNLGFWPTEYAIFLTELAIYLGVAGLNLKRAAVLAIVSNSITIALSFTLQ